MIYFYVIFPSKLHETTWKIKCFLTTQLLKTFIKEIETEIEMKQKI